MYPIPPPFLQQPEYREDSCTSLRRFADLKSTYTYKLRIALNKMMPGKNIIKNILICQPLFSFVMPGVILA
jgi:hypothetical protein